MWSECVLQLCKGISWSLPIWSLVFAAAWFMGHVTKEQVDKAKKKYSAEEK